MFNENIGIRLGLELPSFKIGAMLSSHNQEIEEQVKIGIDNAIKKLEDNKYLSKMVEDRIIETIINAVTKSVSDYEVVKTMQATISKQIYSSVEEFASKMVESVSISLKKGE